MSSSGLSQEQSSATPPPRQSGILFRWFQLLTCLAMIAAAMWIYDKTGGCNTIQYGGIKTMHHATDVASSSIINQGKVNEATTTDDIDVSFYPDKSYQSEWPEEDYNNTTKSSWFLYQRPSDYQIGFALYPQPRPVGSHSRRVYRSHFCQGPVYDDLAQRIHVYSKQEDRHGPQWGRETRVPSHKTILTFGNSHLRQSMLAWITQQMPHGIKSATNVYSKYSTRFDLINNSTVYVVSNSYAPYSQDWQAALRNLTDDTPLGDFDAIIVGNVNLCVQGGTLPKFYRDGIASNLSCDFPIPTPADWMQAYPTGRLLFLTSFMQRRVASDASWARQVLQARQRGRDSVGFVYARHHLETIGHEGSEQSNATYGIWGDASCPTCDAGAHRCIGRYGGYPDLAAFDVAEWMWTGMDSLNHSYTPRPFIQEILNKDSP